MFDRLQQKKNTFKLQISERNLKKQKYHRKNNFFWLNIYFYFLQSERDETVWNSSFHLGCNDFAQFCYNNMNFASISNFQLEITEVAKLANYHA